MKRIKSLFSQLSIRWKLAFWSSVLLCVIFLVYNGVQYFVINQWMFRQEQKAIQKNADEIVGYYKAQNVNDSGIENGRVFIESINDSHQMIRILNQEGAPLLTVSEKMPTNWVKPQVVTKTVMNSAWHEEEHLLIIRSPLQTNQFTGTIEIVNNLKNSDKLSDMLLAVMIAGWIGAIVISGLGGIFLSRQWLRPIQSLTAVMINIKQKGLQERVEITNNNDELAHLAKVFNGLMDQLECSFHNQKQFVEDASHELRTPISIIEGHISLLNRWGKHDPIILEESLNVSVQELERLKEIVNELLELTRAEADHTSGYKFSSVIKDTVLFSLKNFSMLYSDFIFHSNLDALDHVKVHISPNHLEQILVILLDNAVKYSGENKEITINGSLKGQKIFIEVIDRGIGIPQEDVPHLFKRFYRVDKSRSRMQGGTGLGLAIAERLVARYDGEIKISSKLGQGTVVTLSFSIAESD